MHGLESDVIVKLSTPNIYKIQIMLAEMPFNLYMGFDQFSGHNIFVNIQEGFALIYLLCLRNKDIFAEFFFPQGLIVLLLICFIILRFFHNEI